MSTFKRTKGKISDIGYISGRKEGEKEKKKGGEIFVTKVPDVPSQFRRPLESITCSTLCLYI